MQGCPVQSERSFQAAVLRSVQTSLEPRREQHHLYCRTGCRRSRHPGVSWAPLIPARGEGMRRSAASRPGIARPCSEYGTLRRYHRTDDCRAGRPLLCQGPSRPADRAGIQRRGRGLGRASPHTERILVVGDADVGPLQGQPDGGASEAADRARFFERWLALWRETAAELFAPDLAAQFAAKAGRIAESLKLALFYRPGAAASARLAG